MIEVTPFYTGLRIRDNLSVEAVYAAVSLFVAGFVMFPALVGITQMTSSTAYRLWFSIVCWSIVVSAMAIVQAILFTEPDPNQVWGLLTARHILVGLALIFMIDFIRQASGAFFPVLTGLLVGVILVRAVLWFSTDLVWQRDQLSAASEAAGPLRNVFILIIAVLASLILYKTLRQPWPGMISRSAVATILILAIVLAAALSFTQDGLKDMFLLLVVTLPVIAIQSLVLEGMHKRSLTLELQNKRASALADFGTAALKRGGVAPSANAVQMLATLLAPATCEYAESSRTGPRSIVSHTVGSVPPTATEMTIPVDVAERNVGELRIRAELGPEDAAFCRTVGLTLSAALSRIELENTLRDRAVHDPLTTLPNWVLLQDRLSRLIERANGRGIVVICCDVVDMKAINDVHGHDIGDQVLRQLGQKLVSLTSSSGTVARIGSDEFVVASYVRNRAEADEVVTKIVTMRNVEVGKDTEAVNVRLRAGLAYSAGERNDPDKFVRDAEIALMHAKSAVLPTSTYTSHARDAVDSRRNLVRELHQAVADGRITVRYQPIVELQAQRVSAVEALARWRDVEGQFVPPDVFIPLAEQEGLVMELTRHVYRQAIAQLAEWTQARPDLAHLRLSLNLTAKVAMDHLFVSWLRDELRDHRVDPNRLTLELTESVLEDTPSELDARVHELAQLGISISLDDFGTGYSTLSRLNSLPVAELKIDKEFVQSAAEGNQEIIKMIIGLAEHSRLNVVAEGIETMHQCTLLRSLGAQMGQGYLFARPMDAEQVLAAIDTIGGSALSTVDRHNNPAAPAGRESTKPDGGII